MPKNNCRVWLINPLTKGYQIDTIDENGKPLKWGTPTKKHAVNSIIYKIPANHQIIITDMGEINNAENK
jgi:hypothetical protein